jgi:high-affinity Fe2+/Pb2+ permease
MNRKGRRLVAGIVAALVAGFLFLALTSSLAPQQRALAGGLLLLALLAGLVIAAVVTSRR